MFGIAIIGIIIICLFISSKNGNDANQIYVPEWLYHPSKQPNFNSKESIEYSDVFQVKKIMSQNEYSEYRKLDKIAAERGMDVFPKVSLMNLIEARNAEQDLSLLKNKNVDYVIVDNHLEIRAIIILNSNRSTSKGNDNCLIEKILTDVGYRIIFTDTISDKLLMDL